jgi:hypothetical protein
MADMMGEERTVGRLAVFFGAISLVYQKIFNVGINS